MNLPGCLSETSSFATCIHIFFSIDFLLKLFGKTFLYKHCNSRPVYLPVKMVSKTMRRFWLWKQTIQHYNVLMRTEMSFLPFKKLQNENELYVHKNLGHKMIFIVFVFVLSGLCIWLWCCYSCEWIHQSASHSWFTVWVQGSQLHRLLWFWWKGTLCF